MGEILKERGEKFLEAANYFYQKGYYDICTFNLEQAVQLFLKYSLWKILGDFEKTHSIFNLLEDYKKASKKEKEIDELIKKYEETINDLEVAYIEARYLPASFTKNQIDKMFEFLNELKDILGL